MEDEKVVTFTLQGSAGSITGKCPMELFACVLGTGEFPHTVCKETVQEYYGELGPDEKEIYTITVERKFTQKELDNLPESDGTID